MARSQAAGRAATVKSGADIAASMKQNSDPIRATLVCHGLHPWSSLWKRNQSLFQALTARGWVEQGLFINPVSTVRGLVSGNRNQTAGQRRAARRAVVPWRVSSKVRVWTPVHYLPLGRFQRVQKANRILIDELTTMLCGPSPRILIVNNPFVSPRYVDRLIDDASLMIFDVSDDFVAFSHAGDDAARDRTRRRCEELVRRSDLVLAVNDRIAERYKRLNSHTYAVPNGCHYERFQPCADPDFPRSREIQRFVQRYRAVIGYYGWMVSHRINLALLATLLPQHPEWGFVFIGPADRDVAERLRALPNVFLRGPVPQEELPSYVCGFDVCMLPHQVNVHTEGNDPLKLYEYLAAGKPVVASPVAGVSQFGGLVRVASTAEEFTEAIRDALRSDNEGSRICRQRVAQHHSWTARAALVESLLSRVVTARGPAALRRLLAHSGSTVDIRANRSES